MAGMVINSNIMSLNAQNNLNKSQGALSTAMERLSSGLRINSAGDDAAGMAIVNRMTSQVLGLNQSVRNANDGISLIQTTEGALNESSNILQRMRELAIQAANGIYSDGDRSTLNAEVSQLKLELDRIAETTSFNGQKVLDGTLKEIELQVGNAAYETIKFGIDSFDTKTLGGSGGGDIVGVETSSLFNSSPSGTDPLTAGDVYVNGQDLGAVTAGSTVSTVLSNFNANVSGVEFSAITEMNAGNSGTGRITGTDTLDITFTDIDGNNQTYKIGDTSSLEGLADKITSITGGVIEGSVNENGTLQLFNGDGGKIVISYSGIADNASFKDITGFDLGVSGVNTGEASLILTSTDGSDITISSDAAGKDAIDDLDTTLFGLVSRLATDGSGDIRGSAALDDTSSGYLDAGELVINGVEIGAATTSSTASGQADATVAAINAVSDQTGVVASLESNNLKLNSISGEEISIEFLGTVEEREAIRDKLNILEQNISTAAGDSVADVDISTAAGAQKAIDVLDKALEQLNDQRSALGAINNRLDFTVANLASVSENTAAARSRIQDADFAVESANLSRAQILQQAGTAMLAQANAAPQQVLSLLQ